MPDYKYDKADILWEATRRNEEYKKHYQNVLNEFPVNKIAQWVRDCQPGNERWNIQILIDPAITIDEIKKDIDSGKNPEEAHPYYHFLKQYPVIQHKIPKMDFSSKKAGVVNLDTIYVAPKDIKLMIQFSNLIKNRVVVSFDPKANDALIKKEIKKIRKKILKQDKERIKESQKKQKGKFYYPRDIDKYVGWLQKYDEIIDHFEKGNKSDQLTIQNGSFILPEGFNFTDVVPELPPKKGVEIVRQVRSARQLYKDSYEGAVKLIQSTPNIHFSHPRT